MIDSYPEEIVSQGEAAVQLYLASCNEGSAVTVFLRIDVVGRDGAGKTSLTKSLTLQTFDPYELSTKGVVFDPKCQIIVKESCNWTTPLSRKDYIDIYDKNITAIMAESLDKPEMRKEYLSSKVEERPMRLYLANNIHNKTQDKSLLAETVSPVESSPAKALPSLDLAIQRVAPAAEDVVTVDGNSEAIDSRRESGESVLHTGLTSYPGTVLAGCPSKARQRETANPVTETTTEKNDGDTAVGKFVSAVWSKLAGFRKKKKQSSSKKQVPCASPGTASESLEETISVSGAQRWQTSSTTSLLITSVDFPATQQLLPVGIDSEGPMSVASVQELHSEDATTVVSVEQQSKQPQVTTQTNPAGLGVQSSTSCNPLLISELKLEKLETDKIRLVNHKVQEASTLPPTVSLAESSPSLDLAIQIVDRVGAVADIATFDDNAEGIDNRRKANNSMLQLKSTSSTKRTLQADCMPVTSIFPGTVSDALRKPTSGNGTEIPTSSSISSVETSVDCATEQVQGIHSGAATSVVSAQELQEQMRSQPQVTSQANTLGVEVKSISSPPSIPESTKKRVTEMLRSRESRDKVKNEMIVTVLDYAGQNVFYATHQLCLSKEGFYYVVFNASLPLDAITPSVFCIREGKVVHISLPHDETNYDRLEEWISAIHIMELSNSHRIILFEEVGIRSPAVFLVGTHADEMKGQPGMLERQDAFLKNKLEGTVLSEHIVWASKDRMCFYVDNTLTDPQSGIVDEQVVLLRQKTEEVARQVAQYHRLPITWLKFEEEVREVKETDKTKKTASVEEMMQIAMKAAVIKSKEELFVLLHYLSNRSVLLYHPMALKSEDQEEVVLDVEWLISQLEKVITIQTDVPAMFKNAVVRSSAKGIMTMELIKYLLKDSGPAQYLIMSLMNQFDLLCEYAELKDLKQADDEHDYVNLSGAKSDSGAGDIDSYQACFVPCLLERRTTLHSMVVPVEFKTPSLLLSSGHLRMPRPLFYRLLTRLVSVSGECLNCFRMLPTFLCTIITNWRLY